MWAQYVRLESREVRLSTWIRKTHRWLSMLFTLTVLANFAAMAFGRSPSWVVYAPLAPLFLLMFGGLYMFLVPHIAKWRVAH